MTVALMALPNAALAQVPPEAAPDELKDKAVQDLGEQISDEETDAAILKPVDPSAAEKIIDDILEGGRIETAPEIDPDTTLNEETTPNEEWESERDKGSATNSRESGMSLPAKSIQTSFGGLLLYVYISINTLKG